jgi:uncharacterized heparinase superfamily protein
MAAPSRLSAVLNRPPLWGPLALVRIVRRRLAAEWNGAPPHLFALSRPRATAFATAPRDFRPAQLETGRALLRGDFVFGDEAMGVGIGGDPWDRYSPSRRFAIDLHRADWLRHLTAIGVPGVHEGLRLMLQWREVFGRWNAFSWSSEILERRVFNIACALGALNGLANEIEAQDLAEVLGRQGRHLAGLSEPAGRRAERAAVVAIAGTALAGKAGEALVKRGLAALVRALPDTVLADGGHASRSPEAGMELLLDLLTLDDALVQRGMESLPEVGRAVDRLTAGLRFLTLADGRLACFQGGEASNAARVRAARAHDDDEGAEPAARLPHSGFHKLSGGGVEVIVDTGAPATGAVSTSACAQPLAMEIVCGRDRLVTNTGWSERAPAFQAQRLTAAGSTASLGHGSAGRPLSGFLADGLGARLTGGARDLRARREQAAAGQWLEASHDGYAAAFGLAHERRLFLDIEAGELRGEDSFNPLAGARGRLVAYAVHFHLDPDASATLARDNKSVLLRGASERGWWLRNDAAEVRIEPSVHFRDGRPRHSTQVILSGHIHADKGGRVRWKLAAAEG